MDFAFKGPQMNRRRFLQGGAARAVSPVATEAAPEAEEAYHYGYVAHSHGMDEQFIRENLKNTIHEKHISHALRGYQKAAEHSEKHGYWK